jgi:serine/threonine protein kinase
MSKTIAQQQDKRSTMESHFRIIERIAEGGMGKIFLAEDTDLCRKVALKFMPSHLTSNKYLVDRFRREAQAAASLKHPNIVTIYERGQIKDELYIAMEYIEGVSLDDFIQDRQIPIRRALVIAVQICRGLRKAHSVGIIHRDIKPANIMIDNDGWVKILDFGLAKLTEHSRITRHGVRMGTAPYISPEQLRGEELGPGSDIFSLGVILYQLIARQHPFAGKTDEEIMFAILNKKPEALKRLNNKAGGTLQRIVEKTLHKDPKCRYNDVDTLLTDLKVEMRRYPRKEPSHSTRVRTDSISFGIRDIESNLFRISLSKINSWIERLLSWRIGFRRFSLPVWHLLMVLLFFGIYIAAFHFYTGIQSERRQTSAIQKLVGEDDTRVLLQKMEQFRELELIAVDRSVDFARLDDCYLFVVDSSRVLDVFEIRDNLFCSLYSKEMFTSPPSKFTGSRKIWVQDLASSGTKIQ